MCVVPFSDSFKLPINAIRFRLSNYLPFSM